MEFAWILIALVFGVGVRLLRFPPLIGFLLAGFALNFLGYQANDTLHSVADIGITLMLFTIGLKLNVIDLLKREIWLSAISHMTIWITVFVSLIWLLGIVGGAYFDVIEIKTASLLAFALSFSSTVCVVKVLEESGEMKTRHGKLAIGVLVMQDVIAVIFLVIVTGVMPSIWALALILLYWLKPLIGRLLDLAGHGELLPLTGFFLALGGYELFSLVGIKGDLGALILGMLLSKHVKAAELSKALLNFKDIFLIGFFISIGFTTLPDLKMILVSLIISLLLPLKFVLFFGLFTRLQLRGRTAYLAGQVLSNYSEFGLIVVALCVNLGLLANDWLVILALSVCFSFALTSLVYQHSHQSYNQLKHIIRRFERADRLREDIFHQPKDAEILVVGMGRVGKGAYEALSAVLGDKVWAMDADRERVKKQRKAGCKIMLGDAEDVDLWDNIDHSNIKLILLALPSIGDITSINQQLKNVSYQGKLAAIARYEDERQKLLNAGVDNVFNFYTEAGTGFAEESLLLMDHKV
ncbi:cation:proton antiporter domain-containing protein [Neptunicella sp.]|uniref:cation:proton antiporter domain-containing protein n=1 Tax=Neptunicella sp. TaxID=2125986 RepID=UPI003F69489C